MSMEFLETDYDKVEYLSNILTERATGGSPLDGEYKELRSELLQNDNFSNALPDWLRTNRSLDSFWGFIKQKFPSYQERRDFISNEFSEVLDFLEFGNNISYKTNNNDEKERVLKNKVFIVHGHDNETKQEVARFIQSIGLEVIILHEQANSGMTIIEKIEHYTNEADFAIVLYTPCDKGRGANEKTVPARNRARQNVVFEHGYLMAKLGRKHVTALVKGEIETPSDISGVVYTGMDNAGAWKMSISKELKTCGYKLKDLF